MPEAAIRITIRQIKYTNGVAAPENGVENCGLKNVETAGPMMAAPMITAPVRPTALRRSRGAEALFEAAGTAAADDNSAPLQQRAGASQRCLTSDDFAVN